jgi:glycosyltransferase involved in cell wall biosynthesis
VGDGGGRKAALLVYLPDAFRLRADDRAFLSHTNLTRCRLMAEVLGDLGYLVDVVHKRDKRFRPTRDYDLIVSERYDWNGVDRLFPPTAVKAFLVTSMNHATHNENLRRRHARLAERRPGAVELRRGYGETIPALRDADAVVGVGNHFNMDTWRSMFDGPLHGFNNFALRRGVFALDGKDFDSARRHFLFFASRSQMQKGLDLLLEIFPRHPDLHLYVCSQFADEDDFCACYRKELFETPNVHPIGWLGVDQPAFRQLVHTCAFVIHPSCSEGQPGSVVHCMHSGLIPLVTREAGIDTGDFGVTFADDSLDEIEQVILDVSRQPTEWLRQRSEATRRIASEQYSEDAFARRWRSIVSEILTRRTAATG